MRVERGTLDGLSLEQWRTEADIACQCIDEGGTERAEQLARSYGL